MFSVKINVIAPIGTTDQENDIKPATAGVPLHGARNQALLRTVYFKALDQTLRLNLFSGLVHKSIFFR